MSEEKIEVGYREILPGVHHQYLLYTDSAGNQKAASGWPDNKISGVLGTGKIVTTHGVYDENHDDHPLSENAQGSTHKRPELIVSGSDLSGKWTEITQAMDDIEAEGYNYHQVKQNSNTVIGDALTRAGLPEPQNDKFYSGYLSPGSESDFSLSEITFQDDLAISVISASLSTILIPIPIQNIVNTFFLQFKNWTPPRTDPLVLDLDNDGIETVGINGTVVVFDHDGDGIKTGTGWVASDDGFLVLDRNDNGTIDTGAELFGVDTVKADGTLAVDGFDALADLDSNVDSLFDVNDEAFALVQVWRDFNQNGISTADELFSLSELGVVSINLNASSQNVNLGNGNVQTASAAHLTVDGEGQTGNLDLANNPFYSEFVDNIPLTEEALSLPDSKGSGLVRDLREATSLSPAVASALTNLASQANYTDQKAQSKGSDPFLPLLTPFSPFFPSDQKYVRYTFVKSRLSDWQVIDDGVLSLIQQFENNIKQGGLSNV